MTVLERAPATADAPRAEAPKELESTSTKQHEGGEDEDVEYSRMKKRRTLELPVRTLLADDHDKPQPRGCTPSNALRSKWRHDTFSLATTDETMTGPAWTKFCSYQSASSFLLYMDRARGLEKKWWTPNARPELSKPG
ncbi:hypothetical protein BDW71DRAFT_202170 [Aspergillus fruticulosus]